MHKLADCPFCDSDDVKHYKYDKDSPDIVCCTSCGGSTGTYWELGKAREVWNSVWARMHSLVK